MNEVREGSAAENVVAAATDGDESAFKLLVQRHQRELHVHCYRMLGSLEEAEDRVQETFLRAWRKRRTFEGRSTYRVWLYRIATNACIETLRRRPRQAHAPADPHGKVPPHSEMPWLEPYPDQLLDQAAPRDDQPDNRTVAKESIELAFLAVIQLLPPRQRAVLILRDVLRFSAAETASLLDTSVAAANSALQRARGTLKTYRPPNRHSWSEPPTPSPDERALVRLYMEAHEQADPAAVIALLRHDARLMISPPGRWTDDPTRHRWQCWDGRDAISTTFMANMTARGEFRCIETRANRQPAVAFYLRRWNDSQYRAFTLVVLGIEDGALTDITTFTRPDLFPLHDLPATAPHVT